MRKPPNLVFPLIPALAVLAIAGLAACTSDDSPPAVIKPAAQPEDAEATQSRAVLGAPEYWEPAPEEGVELGFGWDSRKGRIVPNRCVRMTPVRASGQVARASLSEVTDTSEVMKSLKVSAAVAVKTMFAKGSAAASFAKSSRVSAQSTTFLLDATVENGVLFAGPYGPADEARLAYPSLEAHATAAGGEPASRLTLQPWAGGLMNDAATFRAYCGDAYVSAITSGARLYATISFRSTSSSQSQKVKTAIEGTYGPVRAEAKAAATHAETLANTSLTVHNLQVGGSGGEIAMSKDALLEKLKSLAGEAEASPQFQYLRLTPYSQMPEWRGTDTWMQAEDEFEVIADYYWQLTNLDDEIETILADYKNYNKLTGKTQPELRAFQDDVLRLRRLIHSAMQPDPEVPADALPASTDGSASAPIELFAAPKTVFKAPSAIDVGLLAGNPTLGQLADELAAASPFGNPSLLRIHLPIPDHVSTATDAATLREAVVDWYVRPRAKRACDRDPTEKDCLTNAELDDVQQFVVVRAGG
ncbi:hypothetical protein [Pseudohaliea sp.]|uniref:hypothetical protein n=1 Tax=Pseudohaliea sp. TaxID=2740289 RepID=UPI0032EAB8B0